MAQTVSIRLVNTHLMAKYLLDFSLFRLKKYFICSVSVRYSTTYLYDLDINRMGFASLAF